MLGRLCLRGARWHRESPVFTSQFCQKPKTALKNKIKEKKTLREHQPPSPAQGVVSRPRSTSKGPARSPKAQQGPRALLLGQRPGVTPLTHPQPPAGLGAELQWGRPCSLLSQTHSCPTVLASRTRLLSSRSTSPAPLSPGLLPLPPECAQPAPPPCAL